MKFKMRYIGLIGGDVNAGGTWIEINQSFVQNARLQKLLIS
jgi:hypothetical protein